MRHQTTIAGALAVVALAAALWAGEVLAAPGDGSPTPKAPRYSEVCAHGHNGFGCGPSSLRADITELQGRVTALEQRP